MFNGSSNWKIHYRGIAGWIRSQRDTSELHPFFKTWIALIETQLAMNMGECLLPEIEPWLDLGQNHAIDPFFVSSSPTDRLSSAKPKHRDAPSSSQN